MTRRRYYPADVLEAAERLSMAPSAIASRIARGMPRNEALTLGRGQAPPPRQHKPRRAPMLREPDRIEEVLDTGRRRRMPPLGLAADPCAGGYMLALVHVDGEPGPRWVAAERLDPAEHGPPPSRPAAGASPRIPRVL